MKIKLTRPVAVRGFPNLQIGEPFECPAGDAAVVLSMDAGVRVSDEEFAAHLRRDELHESQTHESQTVQTREPVVENRDPQVGAGSSEPTAAVRKKPKRLG